MRPLTSCLLLAWASHSVGWCGEEIGRKPGRDPKTLAGEKNEILEEIRGLKSPSAETFKETGSRVLKLASELEPLDAAGAADLWGAWANCLWKTKRSLADADKAFVRSIAISRKASEKLALATFLHLRGELLIQSQREEDALPLFLEAAQLFQSLEKGPEEAHNRNHAGVVLLNANRDEEALGELEKTLKIYEGLPGHEREAMVALAQSSTALFGLGRKGEAWKRADTALERARRSAHPETVGRVQLNRIMMLTHELRFDETFEACDEAERVFKATGDRMHLGQVAKLRATALYMKGDLLAAAQELEKAEPLFGGAGSQDADDTVLNRAAAAIASGHFQEGLDLLDEAEARYRGREDLIAMVTQNRGVALMHLSRLDEALAAFEDASRVFEKLGNKRSRTDCRMNRAGIFIRLGRLGEALREFDQCQRIYEDLGLKQEAAEAAFNRASLLGELGRSAEALEGIDRVLPTLREMGNAQVLAQASMNRASLLAMLKRMDEALEEIKVALEQFRKIGSRYDVALAALKRATILGELERYEESVVDYDLAAAAFEELKNPLELATACLNRGLSRMHLRQFEGAISDFDRALRLYEEGGDVVGIAMALSDRANLLRHQGQFAGALEGLADAADVVARILTSQVQTLGEETSAAFRASVSPTLDAALLTLEKIPSPSRAQVAAAYRIVQVYHGLGMAELLAERGAPLESSLPEELRASRDELTLKLRKAILAREDADSGDRAATLKEARRRADAVKTASFEVKRIEKEIDELNEKARILTPGSIAYPRPATLDEVQAALGDDAALVEFVEAAERMVAFVLTRRDAVALPLFEVQALRGDVDRALEALSGSRTGASRRATEKGSRPGPGSREALRALGKRILDPVLKHLPAGGRIRTLLISPDGDLARVPFEPLLIADGGAASPPSSKSARGAQDEKGWPYLVRDFNVAYVHSGTVLREMAAAAKAPSSQPRDEDEARRFVAFAYPDYGGKRSRVGGPAESQSLAHLTDPERSGYAPLPGTAKEAFHVASLFVRDARDRKALAAAIRAFQADPEAPDLGEVSGQRFTVFFRGAATEDALKTRSEVKDAWVLHLACHGRADLEAPALSHLALSRPKTGDEHAGSEDGIVTLRELRGLGMRAELCVLSACETGAGRLRPFEGLAGLSRAALASGAQSVLSTLWQVEDESARSLVAAFYRGWIDGKQTKAEALAEAKRQAAAKGSSLKTWSAYVLWDSGRW